METIRNTFGKWGIPLEDPLWADPNPLWPCPLHRHPEEVFSVEDQALDDYPKCTATFRPQALEAHRLAKDFSDLEFFDTQADWEGLLRFFSPSAEFGEYFIQAPSGEEMRFFMENAVLKALKKHEGKVRESFLKEVLRPASEETGSAYVRFSISEKARMKNVRRLKTAFKEVSTSVFLMPLFLVEPSRRMERHLVDGLRVLEWSPAEPDDDAEFLSNLSTLAREMELNAAVQAARALRS